MIKRLLKQSVARLGYEIQKKGSSQCRGYDLENEVEDLIRKVRPYTMLSRERLITLYQQVVHCEQNAVMGDFVECGVWKGGAAALMALANLKSGNTRRNIHLFDAFTEICEPDQSIDGDNAVRQAKEWSKSGGVEGKLVPLKGIYDSFGGPGTLEGNRDLLTKEIGYDPGFLHFHQGWFQETLPKESSQIAQIAILRLDGDWYASTRICLEFLYGKVVRGGFVIIDDYGTYEGCRKAVDEFRQKNKISDYLHHIDQPGRYWVKS
jgi:O-methyltransferase